MTKKAKFNFEANLLNLSDSNDFVKAIKEWNFIYKEKYEHQDKTCVCNHKVKNCIFLYNKITKKTIIVGTECYKKFGFEKKKNSTRKTIYHQMLIEMLTKGEYESLEDGLLEYSKNCEEEVKQHYKERMETDDLEDLKDLFDEVNYLIKEFNLNYLVSIRKEISVKINDIKTEQKIAEELEKKRKEELEKKRIEEERILREELEKKRKERKERKRLKQEGLFKESEEETNEFNTSMSYQSQELYKKTKEQEDEDWINFLKEQEIDRAATLERIKKNVSLKV
jgi:hypothetical protein